MISLPKWTALQSELCVFITVFELQGKYKMVQPSLTYLTIVLQAIILAPPEKTEFVFDCLEQRYNLHYILKHFDSALSVIEQALARRSTSMTCIDLNGEINKQAKEKPDNCPITILPTLSEPARFVNNFLELASK